MDGVWAVIMMWSKFDGIKVRGGRKSEAGEGGCISIRVWFERWGWVG